MRDLTELFWNASIEEIKRGYIYLEPDEDFVCLVCGEAYTKGIVYQENDQYYEAERFAKLHVEQEHSSMFECLLSLDKKWTGLSEIQSNLVQLFYMGLSDKEIMKETGSGNTSTIRHHRFTLREKMKQAKVFLSIMELLEEKMSQKEKFIHTHRTPTMFDQRYEITQQENKDILKTYFPSGLNGALSRFPKKQKHKVVILTNIVKRFEANRTYTEEEVNAILQEVYHDDVVLRRYLIDYGFMDRQADGSKYWVKLL